MIEGREKENDTLNVLCELLPIWSKSTYPKLNSCIHFLESDKKVSDFTIWNLYSSQTKRHLFWEPDPAKRFRSEWYVATSRTIELLTSPLEITLDITQQEMKERLENPVFKKKIMHLPPFVLEHPDFPPIPVPFDYYHIATKLDYVKVGLFYMISERNVSSAIIDYMKDVNAIPYTE